MDISLDFGASWENIIRWNSDHGTFRGTGESVSISLAPWSGNAALIRFHYYNHFAGAWDWYVQIDDVRLECATSDVAVSIDTSTPLRAEGQLLEYSVTVTNNGPDNSSSVRVFDYFSNALSFVSADVPDGLATYEEWNRRVTLDFGQLLVGTSKTATIQTIPATRPEAVLRIDAPSAISGNYESGEAFFGPALTESGVSAAVVATAPLDACGTITNASSVQGKIAIIERGICEYGAKVKNAQDAGALGAIITNHAGAGDTVAPMGPGASGHLVTIPSLLIGFTDGQSIRMHLATGVEATLHGDFPELQSLINTVSAYPVEYDPLLSNNTSSVEISVLRDRDSDGTPDTEDQCLTDSEKSSPGICGCGVPDSDSDHDGVVDCRYTETFAARIARVQSVLKALRISGGRIKNLRTRKAALNKALGDMRAYLAANGALINLSGMGVNLQKLTNSAVSKSKSTLTARESRTLTSRRSAAVKALKKLLKGLAL